MRKYLYNLATDKYNGFIARIIKSFLLILSLIYGLIVKILILFYRLFPSRINCKVISVGNITLGGTGKTSLVEYIAKYLKEKGHKVAILTRGYKRKINTMGDEPSMLAMNLKDVVVTVDTNRIMAAKKAIKDYSIDSVILDDGFQQWKIKKGLEIVTIDATNPFGNRYLLPRGILREPLSSLRRADIFVLTKTNLNPDIIDLKYFLEQINPKAIIFTAEHRPIGFYEINQNNVLLDRNTLKGKTVTLISGIGDPDSFENLIVSMGINIGLSFRFPDHYNYTQKDLAKISTASREKNIDTIVTTEKDAVRLYNLQLKTYNLQLLILRIELVITKDEEKFQHRLLSLYSL